jgi:hypothetical protein
MMGFVSLKHEVIRGPSIWGKKKSGQRHAGYGTPGHVKAKPKKPTGTGVLML